jgi:hypothetical protein
MKCTLSNEHPKRQSDPFQFVHFSRDVLSVTVKPGMKKLQFHHFCSLQNVNLIAVECSLHKFKPSEKVVVSNGLIQCECPLLHIMDICVNCLHVRDYLQEVTMLAKVHTLFAFAFTKNVQLNLSSMCSASC